jgi:hypothetical protein
VDESEKVWQMKKIAWGIFQTLEGWNGAKHEYFHSAHWNRERARSFAKMVEDSVVRKIEFEVVKNKK